MTGGASYQLPLRALEDACIRLVVHVASQEINRFLTQIKTWDFVPRSPPTSATSPLVEELIIYLQVSDTLLSRHHLLWSDPPLGGL